MNNDPDQPGTHPSQRHQIVVNLPIGWAGYAPSYSYPGNDDAPGNVEEDKLFFDTHSDLRCDMYVAGRRRPDIFEQMRCEVSDVADM